MRRNTRRYRRVPGTLISKVVERHVDQEKVRTIEADLANIGVGGVFVRFEDPPPKGTIVEVHIDLPERGAKVTALGLVRWCRRGKDAGMGIRFCRIEQGSKEELELLVDSQEELLQKAGEIAASLGSDEIEVEEEEGEN